MTIQDKINEVMDIATVLLKRNDHENYSKCIALIADMLREYNTIEIEEEA